jgi:hypothetical protein
LAIEHGTSHARASKEEFVDYAESVLKSQRVADKWALEKMLNKKLEEPLQD